MTNSTACMINGVALDAMDKLDKSLAQAESVLLLLQDNFEGGKFKINDHLVDSAFWNIHDLINSSREAWEAIYQSIKFQDSKVMAQAVFDKYSGRG
ncbi:hypothetical protein ACUHGC_07615 [Testudinibacter sp. P27/CKL/0425]